jgi:hypothetical protein
MSVVNNPVVAAAVVLSTRIPPVDGDTVVACSVDGDGDTVVARSVMLGILVAFTAKTPDGDPVVVRSVALSILVTTVEGDGETVIVRSVVWRSVVTPRSRTYRKRQYIMVLPLQFIQKYKLKMILLWYSRMCQVFLSHLENHEII